MRIPRVYTDQALACERTIELKGSAAHHLFTVLRIRPDRPLIVFNGQGGEYSATVVEASKKSLRVVLHSFAPQERSSPLAVHLGIAVSKGERMDHVVQKSTELGVSAITPLYSERTTVKLNAERSAKKLRHWRDVVINACEQSGCNRLPPVHTPISLPQWVQQTDAEQKFVLHHRAGEALTVQSQPQSIALLIGPEGGLSEPEIVLARQCGFSPLALGPRVLRTETAPLAALSILQARWGDMAL